MDLLRLYERWLKTGSARSGRFWSSEASYQRFTERRTNSVKDVASKRHLDRFSTRCPSPRVDKSTVTAIERILPAGV
jgi:hypothetical protein